MLSLLKKHLRVETGVPRCLQQLVHEGRKLDDTEEIGEGMEVQLILHLSCVESVGRELQDAAANGHVAAVRLLLDAGLDANFTVETDGQTALMLASGNGHDEAVRLASGSWCSQGFDVPEKGTVTRLSCWPPPQAMLE